MRKLLVAAAAMACALLVVPATSLVQIQVIRGPAARGVSEPPAGKAGSAREIGMAELRPARLAPTPR